MIKSTAYIFILTLIACAPDAATKKKSSAPMTGACPSASQNAANTQGATSNYSAQNQNEQNYDPRPAYQMTGGQLTSEFPSVVFLVRRTLNELHMCSGTFVGPNTIFTAAHCIDNSPTGGVNILTGTSYNPEDLVSGFSANVFAKSVVYANDPSIYANAMGQRSQDPELQGKDFAIIITESANAAPAIAPLSTLQPGLNSEFSAQVVGFGKDESGRVGKKRKGQIKIELYNTGQGYQAYANSQSKSSIAEVAQGDSGGGVFVNGALLGVTTNDNNVSIPVNSKAIQETINRAKSQGAIIGQNIATPQASASINSNFQNQTNCR